MSEETFPLACPPHELGELIEGSREHAVGGIDFSWGMPVGKKKQDSPFTGRWQIASMDAWDVDYVEEEGPAFIEFGAAQMGEFRFGLTSGNINYRLTERGGQSAAEWTWEGTDEMDPCTGRG